MAEDETPGDEWRDAKLLDLDELKKEIRNIKKEIKDVEDQIAKDNGDDGETHFAILRHFCYS